MWTTMMSTVTTGVSRERSSNQEHTPAAKHGDQRQAQRSHEMQRRVRLAGQDVLTVV
jgi:hypothetical protein